MVQELLKGFARFRREEYEGADPSMPRLVEEGQSPRYFIISCIDSRSNPGAIFRPAPGTFLAHKAMGAIVRPYKQGTALAAALQFALRYNRIKEIIVLGHTGCGAIQALISDIEDEEISGFLEVARCGLQKAHEKCASACSSADLHRYAEEQIVLQSVENLKSYPSVTSALEEERVTLRPWLFDMERGALLEYCPRGMRFESIA